MFVTMNFKKQFFGIVLISIGSFAQARVTCENQEQKVMLDPARKKAVITKMGTSHKLKIIAPTNSGFQMFGSQASAFEAEGGIIFGIKDSKIPRKKSVSVFRGGEVIAYFDGCSER